jgi:hypothetical protein
MRHGGRRDAKRKKASMTDVTSEHQAVTAARVVLDHHTELHERLAHPSADLRQFFESFARTADETVTEVVGHAPGRGNMMFYPFGATPEGAGLFTGALAHDLFDARTYQVTAEMVDLMEALAGHDQSQFTSVEPEEVPSPWGFAWFDRPWMATDRNDKTMAIRVMSWGTQHVQPGPGHGTDALRIAWWALSGDPDDFNADFDASDAREALGPLTLVHSETIVLGAKLGDRGLRLLAHLLFSLMEMEITSVSEAEAGRPARRRAQRSIRHGDVRVVQLRRATHDTGAQRRGAVDWSCRWIVRGHRRRLANGNTTWIKPYIKGPDGRPLKASDVVYRLER